MLRLSVVGSSHRIHSSYLTFIYTRYLYMVHIQSNKQLRCSLVNRTLRIDVLKRVEQNQNPIVQHQTLIIRLIF